MIKQRTIKDAVEIEGVGLQTGAKVKLNLKGAPADSGINFIRVDLPDSLPINIRSLDLSESGAKERRTALALGPIEIQTTEHLLAALSGLGIDNIVAEMDSAELPGLDGSAKNFVELLEKAKVIEQDSQKKILKVENAVWAADREALLAIFPDEDFRISYTLSYKIPGLGTQFYNLNLNEKTFKDEIAPARTFCSEEEALELLKRGFGKGANYENTLVIGINGPIKNKLRFQNEPVRHKILDLIGDLYLVGMPIRGHVIAVKSGHRLNMELAKKLKALV